MKSNANTMSGTECRDSLETGSTGSTSSNDTFGNAKGGSSNHNNNELTSININSNNATETETEIKQLVVDKNWDNMASVHSSRMGSDVDQFEDSFGSSSAGDSFSSFGDGSDSSNCSLDEAQEKELEEKKKAFQDLKSPRRSLMERSQSVTQLLPSRSKSSTSIQPLMRQGRPGMPRRAASSRGLRRTPSFRGSLPLVEENSLLSGIDSF
jgi:hypothetical protein